MLKWLSNKIVKWGLKYDEEHNSKDRAEDCVPCESSSGSNIDMDRALRFNVLVCQGGVVLEVRTPDNSSSSGSKYSSSSGYNTKSYIIPENEDVAERVGQIVGMEILRA